MAPHNPTERHPGVAEISQAEYLQIMRDRQPDLMPQKEWSERIAKIRAGVPSDPALAAYPFMPPCYDERLLSPGGQDCRHDPPHGVLLLADELFVRTRHFPPIA